jgi:hypothetical protein
MARGWDAWTVGADRPAAIPTRYPMTVTEPSDGDAPGPKDRSRLWQGSDFVLPLTAAVCVVLGWFVVMDYERTALVLAEQVPGVMERVWRLRLMMAFGGVGGLGLSWLAARDARKRRVAEQELERLNAVLARRVVRRTAELRARTKALRESRLREQLRTKEAEVAFQAGLVEAAGQYLHEVGNALSALELELMRLSRAVSGIDRIAMAFDALDRDIAADHNDQAQRLLASLREAVVGRALPRIQSSKDALVEIKQNMSGELERRREDFERPGLAVRYFQSFRLDQELAAVLGRLPAPAGGEPPRLTLEPVTVRARKHALLTGLEALLRQVLDTATGRVVVSLGQETHIRAVLTVVGAAPACTAGPAVADFINFLNENDGDFRFQPASGRQSSLLVVGIGSAEDADPHPAAPSR